MFDNLIRSARRAIINTIVYEGDPGKIGKADGTVYYTDSAGTFHPDRVWVRLSISGQQTEIVARCVVVNPQLHLPVRVADREGFPTVIGIDRTFAGGAGGSGGGASGLARHWFTHLWLGSDPAMLDPRSFMGFGVRPSDPPALTVDVKGGFYRYGGTQKTLLDQTSGSLSAYVPASSGIYHYLVLCLDRENNVLEIVDGADHLTAAGPITRTQVNAVSIPDAYWPLSAIRLQAGQTEVRLPDIIFDVRNWAGEGSGSFAGGANFDLIMTDANGAVMVDANGNVMIGAG